MFSFVFQISKKALNMNKSNTPRSGKKLKSKVPGSKVNLSISSYGKFQEHLEERNELRSSMLPDQVLENASERGHMKTPVRTPAKPLRKNLLSVPTSGTPRPASSSRATPRSPRVMHTPRLATMPNNTHFIF